jgi:hypothetical protein
VEISLVRKRLLATMDRARRVAQERRHRASDAQLAYDVFVEQTATPVVRMLANALKAEGYSFTMFTPGGTVRLAFDKSRDDYIEIALDSTIDPPEVVARVSRSRGSRTIADERPVKPGARPDAITKEEILEFLLIGLEPWLER